MRTTRCFRTVAINSLLSCLLCWSAAPALAAAAAPAVQRELERTIVTLAGARDRARDEAAGMVPGTRERQELQLFSVYLDGRVITYCRELVRMGGTASLAGLPCPAGSTGGAANGRLDPVPEPAGRTSAETVAALDQDLQKSLAEFDDMLLAEQETIAARVPRQRESGGGAAGAYGGDPGTTGERDPGRQRAETGQDSAESDEAAPPVTTEPTGGAGAGAGQPPADPQPGAARPEPSGDEDDIVARQLREAAEQETDPEVKEKLWEEYRRYKEGIR